MLLITFLFKDIKSLASRLAVAHSALMGGQLHEFFTDPRGKGNLYK